MLKYLSLLLGWSFLSINTALASCCDPYSDDTAPIYYHGFTSLDFPDFTGPPAPEPYLFESGSVRTLLNPDQKLFGAMDIETPFQRFNTMTAADWHHIQNVFRWSTEAVSMNFLDHNLELPPAQRQRVFQLILNECFDGTSWTVKGSIYPRLTCKGKWTDREQVQFLGHTFEERDTPNKAFLPLAPAFCKPSLFTMSATGLKTLREKLLDCNCEQRIYTHQVRANGSYPHHYFSCPKCHENPEALSQENTATKTHAEPILNTSFTAEVKMTPHIIPYRFTGKWDAVDYTNNLGSGTWCPDHHFTSFAYLPWNYLESLAHHVRAYGRTAHLLTGKELPLSIRFMFENHFHSAHTNIPAHLEATFELRQSPALSVRGLDVPEFTPVFRQQEILQELLRKTLAQSLAGFSLKENHLRSIPRVPFFLLRYDQQDSGSKKNSPYGERTIDRIKSNLLGYDPPISMYVASPLNAQLSATINLLANTQTVYTHNGLMGRHVVNVKDIESVENHMPANPPKTSAENKTVSCESDSAFEHRVFEALRTILKKAEPLQFPTPQTTSSNNDDDDDEGHEQPAQNPEPFMPLVVTHGSVIDLILKGFGKSLSDMKNPELFCCEPLDNADTPWHIKRRSLDDTQKQATEWQDVQ